MGNENQRDNQSGKLNPADIIARKRDGHELTQAEIDVMVTGAVDGSVPDYQLGAWLMAFYLRGAASPDEIYYLTRSIMESGEVLSYPSGPPLVDKHSTGGIGDKTSFIIAPICAAAGLRVPMISGRALGFTGGTLDKLESIPGFQVIFEAEKFRDIVEKTGVIIAGQSGNLAPGDRRIYTLRDFTSTVSSVPLISSSIMGKKLAAGVDAVVLDIKVGSGAFIHDLALARELATSMIYSGGKLGKKVGVVFSRMEAPLGNQVGNATEIAESLVLLRAGERARLTRAGRQLWDLCCELAAVLLYFGGKATNLEEARELAAEILRDGRALKKFEEMVAAQGGDLAAFETKLASEREQMVLWDLKADREGVVHYKQADKIGQALTFIGGGRYQAGDPIDHFPALEFPRAEGEPVGPGEPMARAWLRPDFAADAGKIRELEAVLRSSVFVGQATTRVDQLVIDREIPEL